MLDIVRDPRWGRVMESNGEDPYLSGVLGQAYIKGYQQELIK
jgi:beta-glucosidase